MARRIFLVSLVVLALMASTTMLFAQGVQTATLLGKVTGPDGGVLPGVTVTVTSPALQGERTAYTTTTGEYILRGLPPGDYTVTFALEGMQTLRKKLTLSLGLEAHSDAELAMTKVAEAITVTASSPTVLENTTVGANITKETVQELPIGRTPTAIGSLSPGVTGDRGGRATTPVAGQMSISGGLAYDNNFLINGVNFQDNIFGNTNNMFIEDAIQETQVLTSGISAEYGHFTGGVLNVITKSGGNQFTASIRDDMTNPSWTANTPFENGYRGAGVPAGTRVKHSDTLSNVWEATFGGPILRDRLWFFLAGRDQKQTISNITPVTGAQVNNVQTNRRPEVKLTGTIASNHTLQFDYIENPLKNTNEFQVTPLDTSAISQNSSRPNREYTGFYNGVLTSSLFAEARYSKKTFGFRGLGGTLTDIQDSPFESSTAFPGNTTNGTYNAPYFDATDPEDRDNSQAFAALSYFVSTPRFGSHDIKAGFEDFKDWRTGGNSQTATNYVFYTGYAVNPDGSPVIDATGRLAPSFVPISANGSYYTGLALWIATRGAKLTTTTDSFFVNDRWNLNSHLSFNIGARYEHAKTTSTGGAIPITPPVDTSNIVPRLAASYDPLANGRFKFDVTYSQYVGRYNPGIIGANSPVGNPAYLYGYYVGPAGQGRNFAPGFDPKNYVFYTAGVPTANISVAKGLHAPINNEWSFSAGTQLPKGGWAKATFTDRRYTDFVGAFTNIAYGCTNVSLQGINVGCVDNVVYQNTNGMKRDYQALELQSHYDITKVWGVEGNWTHQFKNDGNYEGESGQSFSTGAYGVRPEMQSPRELPLGHLAQYEADRLRLWTTYNLDFNRFGNLSAGLIYRYDSPLTFSYTAAVPRSAISKADNPGYHNASNTVTLFFGNRGAGSFNGTSLFDLSLQYNIPIYKITPWVKFDVTNLLNSNTQLAWNTSIKADPTSPKDAMGYPTGYTLNPQFGRPSSTTSYVLPRQYLVYVGARF